MTSHRRSIAALAFSFLVLAAAAPASADSIAVGHSVTVSIQPSYLPGFDVSRANNGFSGGPFQITNTTTPDTWITFCIERGQSIADGVTYQVKNVGTTASDGTALSNAAAWLFESFRSNGLGGLGAIFGSEFAADNAAHTKLVQLALWLAQSYNVDNQSSVDERASAALLLAHAAGQQHSGIVRIVQLEQQVGGVWVDRQDVLALQPVPEPASMLLLGGGLLGLAAARRRRAGRQ